MPKTTKTPKKPKVVSGEGYCRKCEKTLSLSKFYETTNPMIDSNNFMSVCRECCADIYNKYFSIYNNIEKALYLTCEDLDIRFSKEALRATQKHIESLINNGRKADAVFGYYKSKLSSIAKQNGMTNFRFKNSDFFGEEKNKNENNFNDYLDNSDFELNEDIIKFWGYSERFDKRDYEYLTNKYIEYINTYECETPTMEELLKQAAFESLEIRLKRLAGDDVTKNLKSLQEILGSANIKPNQETGANATEQMTFGLLIKKWENEEPIPEPDEEWKDVDGIGKYIRIWFLGHLCKMLGINNEFSKEYEEEMSKFRVEMPSNDKSLDDLEEGE
jgi:hypothetical protein